MSSVVRLEAAELGRFSMPHALRLTGEQQHLLGFGSIALAGNLRLNVEVEERGGDFSLYLGGAAPGEDAPLTGGPLIAEFAVRYLRIAPEGNRIYVARPEE